VRCVPCAKPRLALRQPGDARPNLCTKLFPGTVSERPKVQLSKSCVGVEPTVGSNPTGSAKKCWSEAYLELCGVHNAHIRTILARDPTLSAPSMDESARAEAYRLWNKPVVRGRVAARIALEPRR
jgi:hypothetical protein